MRQSVPELKRKLRQLKKLEIKIRFNESSLPHQPNLIWDLFFSTKTEHDSNVKYSLNHLLQMDQQSQKAVYEAYFYGVYFQYYKENGILSKDVYDPTLLSSLDLPPDTGAEDIKKKFRELAKKYHPDHGGDSDKFLELMDIYEKLTV